MTSLFSRKKTEALGKCIELERSMPEKTGTVDEENLHFQNPKQKF